MALRKLCARGDIAEGEMRDFEIDGVEIVVTWCADHEMPTAFNATCPHQEISLALGDFDGQTTLTCEAHGWSFDARSGECLFPRRANGQNLKRYTLVVEQDEIFVDVADKQ